MCACACVCAFSAGGLRAFAFETSSNKECGCEHTANHVKKRILRVHTLTPVTTTVPDDKIPTMYVFGVLFTRNSELCHCKKYPSSFLFIIL
jgi:hypothetical protein